MVKSSETIDRYLKSLRPEASCAGKIFPVLERVMIENPDLKKRVLIYERRSESADILARAFKALDFDTEVVCDKSTIPDKVFDLLVTEIEDCNDVVEKVYYYNPKVRVLIFSNFSRDEFIKQVYSKEGIGAVLEKSYKVNDIVQMSDIALRVKPDTMFGLNQYMDNNSERKVIRSLDFKLKKESLENISIGETVFEEIDEFLKKNDLTNDIEDVDMLHYAIGELIDNSIEAQVSSGNEEIELFFEYGYDNDKFGFSIHDKLGTLSSKSVVTGIGLKMYDENGGTPPEYYKDNTYFGPRGRGYYIIQYAVHRLSVVILSPQSAEKYNTYPRTDATLLVYFGKKRSEIENQIGPVGVSMVITI